MTIYYMGKNNCSVGSGLTTKTAALLVEQISHPSKIMTASSTLAETYFSQFVGWTRVLSAPSLADLESKAARALTNSTPYEVLGYGLESSSPAEEVADMVAATTAAKVIAGNYGKFLMMAPGFQLMSANEGLYDDMSALSDMWLFQTQKVQSDYPPGTGYYDECSRVIGLIRAGHADIPICAQILIPPNETPDPQKWLSYYYSIFRGINSAYIGAYLVWDYYEEAVVLACMENIFDHINLEGE
jgi:hypothetical protein